MRLHVDDLQAASLAAMPAGSLAHATHAAHWQRELQHAGTRVACFDPAPRQPQAHRDDDAADLESCGAPVVAGPSPTQAREPVHSRTPLAEESQPVSESAQREVERSPVRLHVQALPDEAVKVWLGIDGDAALVAQRASAAVADLRRSLQSTPGGRVASIVCNGVVVYPRAPSSAAPVARSPILFLKESP